MFITSGMACSQGEDMVAFGSGLRYISSGHTRALGYAANVFLVFLVVSSLPAVLTINLQGTSNTCLSRCGNITIPYPFGTSPGCGLPEFSLNCISHAGSNFSADPALLLSPPCGPSGNFYQVTSISANTLIIRATNLVAASCAPTVGSGSGSISVCLGPASAPYVLTSKNNLFAWGCSAWGELNADDQSIGTCNTDCISASQNEVPYCLNYECCSIQFPISARNITINAGGNCGHASVVYPPSHVGGLDGREWGVQLGWAIPGPSCRNATTLGNYSCAATATCQDAQFPDLTGYTCACSAGYDGDGYADGIGCNDINECLNSTLNNCSKNAKCTNTNGSYYCNCATGFLGDGYTNGSSCTDINECLNSTLNNCSKNAKCTNTNGSYYCNCATGFLGDGYTNGSSCTDINECLNSTLNNCSKNAKCTNTNGSYYCNCATGFLGDGYTNGSSCTDINECLNSTLNNCSKNAKCTNTNGSYYCNCATGFLGDGYTNGSSCTDINECLNSTLNNCSKNAKCTNTNGSYYCNCTNGFYGDGSRDGTGCQSIRKRNRLLVAGLSTTAAILVGLGGVVLALLCRIKKTRKHTQFAQRNFEALGKLQDFFTALTDGESNTTTLFSLKELEKATNGFADDQKLGVGGFGTVYKGTMESGLIVAVKRTNKLDTSGAQQFLNEMALLSQVNHRNLVRLHGCCLETEVPMLVYEYVPNGNLSEHLRGEKSSELGHLTWPKRMQIAIETAEAITYLHSEANPPIYHRDVKSSNILLNNMYGVKVSDFGISKLIPLDATHVSTIAQGTPGYWDPEYFLSYQLTDKSDVYSFGVILLELITSQPPVDLNRDKMETSLVAMCIPQIKEGNFEAIVDPKLLSSNFEEMETTLQEIEKVATMAMHCLAFKGDDRPSMKQVTEVLHQIKGRNCQWSEGRRNKSSEFGLVGVHEIKSVQELELF